jgi:hypothetical protein
MLTSFFRGGVAIGVVKRMLVKSRLEDYPGREIDYEKAQLPGFHCRQRVWIVGGQVYQLLVISQRVLARHKDLQRFLDFFQLLPTR